MTVNRDYRHVKRDPASARAYGYPKRCPRCRTKNFYRRVADGVCFHCVVKEQKG